MCNGCRHGFTCCAYDGDHCGCEMELTMACSRIYCDACDVWSLDRHDHEQEEEAEVLDY